MVPRTSRELASSGASWPAGVGLGYIPFWTVIFFAIGLVLLVALSAAGGLRDVAAWSALFLFVLWILQIGKVAGVYRFEQDLPPGSSWATQYASYLCEVVGTCGACPRRSRRRYRESAPPATDRG